jgi:hypothetical protein
LNRRKKALRDWTRKWAKQLKILGYQVAAHREGIVNPVFIIEKIPPNDDDDAIAQLEKEKLRNYFDPKRQRSKRLGKKPEE